MINQSINQKRQDYGDVSIREHNTATQQYAIENKSKNF